MSTEQPRKRIKSTRTPSRGRTLRQAFSWSELSGRQIDDKDILLKLAPDAQLYQYTPLPEASIRLIRILPESMPGSISCQIEINNIHHSPRYIALSYTWGNPGNEKAILLDGTKSFVRQNLASFLESRFFAKLYATTHEAEPLYWIDQIAIDQSNVSERTHQVGLMRQIYTNASQVTIWLGDERDNSDMAMQILQQASEAGGLETISGQYHSQARDLAVLASGYIHYWNRTEPYFPQPWDEAISALTQRPYWRRTWILQEVFLARNSILSCGSRSVNWGCLGSKIRVRIPQSSPMMRVYRGRKHFQEGTNLELQDLLYKFQDHDTSEIKDEVFGLLGIATVEGGGRPDYHIDYSPSVEEVYRSVLAAYGMEGTSSSSLSSILIRVLNVMIW